MGIVYSVKVPSVVRGMWCAVCGQECWFYVSRSRNGRELKKVYIRLSFPRYCAPAAYHYDIAVQSPYTNPTILSYVSGRTSPSVNVVFALCYPPSLQSPR